MLYRSIIYLSVACGFIMVHASESEREVLDKKEFDRVVADLAQSKSELQSQAELIALLHSLLSQRESELQKEAIRAARASRARDELRAELDKLRKRYGHSKDDDE